jgi:peptidoglycan/LPS O-acetylase OafA/YrhL
MLARWGDSLPLLSGSWLGVKGVLVFVGIWMVSVVLQLEVKSTSILYIGAADLFIVSSTVFLFSLVAYAGVAAPWRWVRGTAYASYFIYLFHRPLWAILAGIMPASEMEDQLLFRLLPASAVVVIACYYLQSAYDALIREVGRKYNR